MIVNCRKRNGKLDLNKFDLWHKVFDYLPMNSLVKVASVSKNFFLHASNDYLYPKFDVVLDQGSEEYEDELEESEYSSLRSTEQRKEDN